MRNDSYAEVLRIVYYHGDNRPSTITIHYYYSLIAYSVFSLTYQRVKIIFVIVPRKWIIVR